MENNLNRETEGHGLPKIPSLVQHISSNDEGNFDNGDLKNLSSSFKVSLVIILWACKIENIGWK